MGAAEYDLIQLVGRGGTADVFYAERRLDDGTRQPVAVKRYRVPLTGDAPFRRSPYREARAGAELRHPNIVEVLDVIDDGDGYRLVMEWIDGLDLARLTDLLLPTVPDVIYIARNILEALAHAHDHGVIHRDMTPHNVLLSCDGHVKVADFGQAKGLLTTDVTSGGLQGKLGYIAPESAQRKPLDHRIDLYAVGVTLYKTLTGRLPYRARNVTQFIHHQMTREPRSPRTLRSGIPKPLEAIVLRLLARDPADRYQHARDVIHDLDQLASLAELADPGPGTADSLGQLVTVCSSGVLPPTAAPDDPWASDAHDPSATGHARLLWSRRTASLLAALVIGCLAGAGTVRALSADPPGNTIALQEPALDRPAPSPERPEPSPPIPQPRPAEPRHYDTLAPEPPVKPPVINGPRRRLVQETSETVQEPQPPGPVTRRFDVERPTRERAEKGEQLRREVMLLNARETSFSHFKPDKEHVIGRETPSNGKIRLGIDTILEKPDYALVYFHVTNRDNHPYNATPLQLVDQDGDPVEARVVVFGPSEWAPGQELMGEVPAGATQRGSLMVGNPAALLGQTVGFILSEPRGERRVVLGGVRWPIVHE